MGVTAAVTVMEVEQEVKIYKINIFVRVILYFSCAGVYAGCAF